MTRRTGRKGCWRNERENQDETKNMSPIEGGLEKH
jgi:hypothetical protein